jgi:molecular chaperone DnaK
MKGDDKAAIEAKTAELGEKSGKLAERVYKEQSAEGTAGSDTKADSGAAADSDVVDAEFEEVKDSDNK